MKMKYFTGFILFTSLFLVSCNESYNTDVGSNLKASASMELKYAQWFSVDYFDTYKLITVLNPWTKLPYWKYKIFNSKRSPKNEAFLTTMAIPDKSIVLSSTQIGMFNKLSLLDKIVSVSNRTLIANSELLKKIDEGKVGELGDGLSINNEKAYLTQADIIFTTAWDKLDPNISKLIEQNKPTAFVMDWQENSPLARAEWIKFVAAFYNIEEQAASIFNKIEAKYNELKTLSQTAEHRSKILHGTPMSGTWYIAGGQSYMAYFYKDAAADYLWKNDSSNGSLPLSFEAVFDKAQDADFWFNTLEQSSWNELINTDERFLLFKAVKQKQVYTPTPRRNTQNPNLFWEEGTVNPDLVLEDLVSILHPELLPNHRLNYYKVFD